MVLSLAPIITESVTKPNVSLTQARITEAQEHFRHAGNGQGSEAGEGLVSGHPKTWETFLARPRRPPRPAAHPARGWGLWGSSREAAGGQTRTVQPRGQTLGVCGQCWGRSSPVVFPPLCQSGWSPVTTGRARWERRGHLLAKLKSPKGEGNALPDTLTGFHKGAS